MSVFVDGSTLSALFYCHANSAGNQEGLLLGQTVNHVKDHISDSQINNAQVQTYMYVSSHIPWPNEDKVYSKGGIPIIEKLAALLGDSHNKEEVVGWYSFRRNSTLRMSMKECTVHKHLESRFSQNVCGNFLFFLCVESVNGDCTTFSMDYCFFLFNTVQKKMKKVLATITNLGDTLPTQYKTHGHASVSPASAEKKIVQQLRYNFVLPSDEMAEVTKISAMSNTLSQSLLTLSRKVTESELKTGELEGEVQRLRDELRKKEEAYRALHRQQALESSGSDNCQHQAIDVDLLAHPTDQTSGRLVVHHGQKSADVVPPSIDDLLSMPAGPSSLDVGLEPVPHCSHMPVSSALESVMDSIADSDDDEPTGCLVQPSKGRRLTRAMSSCGAKEKDVNHTTVASIRTEKLKTGDHFAFVNSLMTEKNGSLSDAKTGLEPKGFTKINSRQFTRSTRSQTKNSIDDVLQTKVTTRSASGQAMAGICSDHTGSPSLQGKRQLEAEFESFSEPVCRRLPEKVYNIRSGGGGEAGGRCSNSDPQGSPVSRSRAQMNSTKTNLVVRRRSRSEASADRTENIQATEVKKRELVPQQNGSVSPDHDILDPLKPSSSPVF